MDETQIAENLKKNIPEEALPKSVPDQYPEVVPNTEPDHSSLPLENYVLKQEVSEFLGLPNGYKNNPEMIDQLDRVIAWASDVAGTHEVDDVMHVLFKRQSEMGIRDKPDRLLRLYQYVKISSQIDHLYERQRALYG